MYNRKELLGHSASFLSLIVSTKWLGGKTGVGVLIGNVVEQTLDTKQKLEGSALTSESDIFGVIEGIFSLELGLLGELVVIKQEETLAAQVSSLFNFPIITIDENFISKKYI